jgi:nucleotide-binding universal stress UspA family protein
MYKRILVPVDITDAELTKPAIAAALTMAKASGAEIRLVNVLPLTPVMLAEYVPPDFEVQQRQSTEEALEVMIKELGLEAGRVTATVRQGGVSHEVLEEAVAIDADLICMSSHRPAMRNILLGSNASHVVRYAKCSVLVVRNPHSPQ